MYLVASGRILVGMHSGQQWRLGHRPGLDGLRGIAILLVLIAHFGIRDINPSGAGNSGVTVFFTLSGFLITALLLEEHSRTGRVSRGRFYLRRVRRLVPALLVCLVLAIALELTTLGRVIDWDLIRGALTYTSNFAMADGHFGDDGRTFIGQMWSLAIEEQFYLVWPFVLLVLVRLSRPKVMIVLAYAAMAGIVLRHLLWNDGAGAIRIWMGTDTRSDALLIGCLLAFCLHGQEARTVSRWWGAGGGVLLLLLLPWRLSLDPETAAVGTPLLAALAAALMIYPAVNRAPGALLGSPVLRYLGSRSYGIYLYHAPILTAVHETVGTSMTTSWVAAGPVVLVVSELSWRFVEQPFLRSRRQEHPDELTVGAGGVECEGAAPGLEELNGHRVGG
jgi:peptidoglycan/LPS O-acetylase OafA/YrhL